MTQASVLIISHLDTIRTPSYSLFNLQKQSPEVFCKKVLFKILQNSQKNTWARISFLQSTSGRLLLSFVNILLVRFSQSFHCVKRLQIWSFYWSVFSCIWTEYGAEKIPYLDNFLPLFLSLNILYYLQQLFCHS